MTEAELKVLSVIGQMLPDMEASVQLSYRDIADLTGLSRRHVIRTIDRLVLKEAIRKLGRAGTGPYATNIYALAYRDDPPPDDGQPIITQHELAKARALRDWHQLMQDFQPSEDTTPPSAHATDVTPQPPVTGHVTILEAPEAQFQPEVTWLVSGNVRITAVSMVTSPLPPPYNPPLSPERSPMCSALVKKRERRDAQVAGSQKRATENTLADAETTTPHGRPATKNLDAGAFNALLKARRQSLNIPEPTQTQDHDQRKQQAQQELQQATTTRDRLVILMRHFCHVPTREAIKLANFLKLKDLGTAIHLFVARGAQARNPAAWLTACVKNRWFDEPANQRPAKNAQKGSATPRSHAPGYPESTQGRSSLRNAENAKYGTA